MSDEKLKVETELQIAKPAQAVFEAIVNPEQMSCYFTTTGSGRLDAGDPVVWKWDDCGAELTATPQEIQADSSVSYLWSASGIETLVSIQLEQEEGTTTVKVTESGWPRDDEGTARCLEQMQGWMHMLCCLKAWLEHGINLRI